MSGNTRFRSFRGAAPRRCGRPVTPTRAAEWLVMFIGLTPLLAHGQDTTDVFRQNCQTCHTIGGGRLTGPDLKDVTERKDREWLIGFMMNPKSYVDRGDPYALKILQESRNYLMPALPGMTRELSERLLALIEAESALDDSQFQGSQMSSQPFTDADRARGREIFTGRARLERGGAACISCHSMYDLGGLGGGRLGVDLTNVFAKLGDRKALGAWLTAPATPTMQPIFKSRPLTPEEIHALVAYFESAAGEGPADSSVSRVSMLLMGLVGAAAAVFGLDAIWKRRFHSVRQSLVDARQIRGYE